MTAKCTICERADVASVDAALQGAASFRAIAKAFGTGRTAIGNHATHVGAAETRGRRAAAKGRVKRKPVKSSTEVPKIETPADVARELEWQYREAKALVEHGKATSDTRLIDKALATCGGVLDKFAKILGLYTDGATITVDRSTKVLAVLADLPEADLRRLLAGDERAALPTISGSLK